MANVPDPLGVCERCGDELRPTDPAPHCARCAVEMADGSIGESTAPSAVVPRRPDPDRMATIRRRVMPIMLVVLAVVLAVRIPTLVSAFEPAPTAHDGLVTLDQTGDRCLANLWSLASAMSDGRPLDRALKCPASGRLYSVAEADGVTTVSCPDPVAHGAVSLAFRSDHLVPEVR